LEAPAPAAEFDPVADPPPEPEPVTDPDEEVDAPVVGPFVELLFTWRSRAVRPPPLEGFELLTSSESVSSELT